MFNITPFLKGQIYIVSSRGCGSVGGALLGLLLFTKLLWQQITEHWLPAVRWKSSHRNPWR